VTTFLVSPERFAAETLAVEGDAYRHLIKARRLEVGERVRVVDGLGAARWARCRLIGRRSAELELGDSAPSNEPTRRVEVWVAPPRVSRASWMVEKLTEVGARSVRFVSTERTPRAYGGGTLERLRRVAAAALEQSGRSFLPEVSGVHPWAEAVEALRRVERLWLLTPGANPVPGGGDENAETALIVGPEGGWSEAEIAELTALPARPVGLGPTTLRVETAALVAAASALLT
jgi:16S rRNA (uracil1498-N3)-methyltransferase